MWRTLDPSCSPSAIEVYQLTEFLSIQREASISALIQAPILDCQSPTGCFRHMATGWQIGVRTSAKSPGRTRPAGALGSLVLVIDALQGARTSPVSGSMTSSVVPVFRSAESGDQEFTASWLYLMAAGTLRASLSGGSGRGWHRASSKGTAFRRPSSVPPAVWPCAPQLRPGRRSTSANHTQALVRREPGFPRMVRWPSS